MDTGIFKYLKIFSISLKSQPLAKLRISSSRFNNHTLPMCKRERKWVIQSCLTLCDHIVYTVRGNLQPRILEWAAFPFSRGSSQPRDQTLISHIAGGFFTVWATRDAPSVQFSSVAQSCRTLCNPMNCSTPGLPVHHQLPEFTQTPVHRVGDAIQPSHPLSSPSPPAHNPFQI